MDAVMSGPSRGRAVDKLLLSTGVAAVVVYALGDVLSGVLYDGYSWADQAISELSAFGSPVRPLMVGVILVHNVLLLAFGVGILRVATRRSLRWIGILLVADFVVVGLTTHTLWAMSSRDMATGFNDTMHIALSAVFSVLVVAMMVLSAVAYRGWFRVYALATVAVVTVFGMASAAAIRGIEENDTPWAGAFERVNAYAYFAWLAVLAARAAAGPRPPGGPGGRRHRTGPGPGHVEGADAPGDDVEHLDGETPWAGRPGDRGRKGRTAVRSPMGERGEERRSGRPT